MKLKERAKSWNRLVVSSWITKASLVGLFLAALFVTFAPERQLLLPWLLAGIGIFFIYVGTGVAAGGVRALMRRRPLKVVLPAFFALILMGAGAQALVLAVSHVRS